jgi:pimeloyl-ACP methyl ester carboxylesterase
MPNQPLLPGISSTTIATARLKTHILTSGPADGVPVVLVHGNASSNRFWEELMLALPATYRAIAPDLRGYGESETLPVDATRGLRDFSDDLKALAAALNLERFHLVGWSMGGNIGMQYAIDHPADLLSLTLNSAGSPFGFGGTKDIAGTPTFSDYAGSGGGTANPDFVKRLAEGDRGAESPTSPRTVMNSFYWKPPFKVAPEREEAFVSAILSTKTTAGNYPGDLTTSDNWPGLAPGTSGPNNAISPKYLDHSGFAAIDPRPPVLWVRGANDQIVSDTSLFDFGFLGQLGAVPGWPGAEVYPPQPMVSQLRGVLESYRAAGGRYWEKVMLDCGHSPHIEKPEEFLALLLNHLASAGGSM